MLADFRRNLSTPMKSKTSFSVQNLPGGRGMRGNLLVKAIIRGKNIAKESTVLRKKRIN